jgi:hypothetical protein
MPRCHLDPRVGVPCPRPRASARAWLALFSLLLAPAGLAAEAPPPGLKVAFIGDQGLGPDAIAVLQLIAAEGADAVVHSGDFDYGGDPAAWNAQIDSVLGADFPYFASIGNHDESRYFTSGGYQSYLTARMIRLGIPWSGNLGVQSTFHWNGLHFVMTAPGIVGQGDGLYDLYIRDQFAASDAIWRISSWHKNQHLMQTGDKTDETGWGVYEQARRAGAILATAHEHAYSRTHLLSSMELQTIASTAQLLVLTPDEPVTPADEGRSFDFVSGLGGESIRDQNTFGDWFASVYTLNQGARYGALFAVFHVKGDPRLARFYFKDVDGRVIDDFSVRSRVGCNDGDDDGVCDEADDCLATPNPSQLDGDFDGYGNACDADYSNDGTVGIQDLMSLGAALGSAAGDPGYAPALDVDGDGAIGDPELAFFASQFGRLPGPSGLGCAGSAPCVACDAPDTDGDGLCDPLDSCLATPGAPVDSDLDGYGDACDPDFTNDGVVGLPDYLMLGMAFGSRRGEPGYAPALDMNDDGTIGLPEFLLLGARLGSTPGPSGLDCAGSIPCLGR